MASSAAPETRGGPGQDPEDFSLVLGGPLFQLMRRARLTDDALSLQRRRIVVIALVAWLPLLLLSAIDGQLLGGVAAVPFLLDVEVHAKLLLVVPLLVAAELVVHQRMRSLGKVFRERELVPHGAEGQLDDAIASAYRLRNSVAAEVLLIAFVYLVGILFVWRHYMALDTSTWYATAAADGSRLTPAGMWYGFVSLPVFQFLLLRWYFRLFIWARLLSQVSRIQLQLVPTHPDRAGGLAFVSTMVHAFIPLLMAHGALFSGNLANRIFHLGATLPQYRLEILLLVLVLLLLILGPLAVFAPLLARTKRAGLREYGTLAQRYVREFDTKWLRGGAPAGEPLVGSADVQSLADLGNSYEVVRSMRVLPVTRDAILQLTVATLIPIAPLLLTIMPLEDLLKKLFGMLF
jgi:hypothetical protein